MYFVVTNSPICSRLEHTSCVRISKFILYYTVIINAVNTITKLNGTLCSMTWMLTLYK